MNILTPLLPKPDVVADSGIDTAIKLGLLLCLTCALSACATYEYHETKIVTPIQLSDDQEAQLTDNQLLDVGIVLFDAGIDELDDESVALSSVRKSEAVWFASQLKKTLEQSNAWGLVRTKPDTGLVTDLSIAGQILESNGEVVRLAVTAVDASNRVWLDKEYFQRASAYAYSPEIEFNQDPFQSLFNEIANDLFNYRAALGNPELAKVRNIAKVRVARDFAPNAFNDFVVQDDQGHYQLQRLPASTDPMMLRIERIQARNDLFLDVIEDYYRGFNKNMSVPYEEYRKLSYKDVLYERQLREQARKERIAGLAAIAVGVLASASSDSSTGRAAGAVSTVAGASIFRSGFLKVDAANAHAQTLRELGYSLEAELEPSVIDLQDRSVTLSGTVQDQFKEWRQILQKIFEAENPEALLSPTSSEQPLIESTPAVDENSPSQAMLHIMPMAKHA